MTISISARRALPTARAAATLTAALLTAGLLAGCAGTDTAEESAASAVSASPSPSPESSDSASAAAADEVTEWSYPGESGRTALELLLESDPSAEVSGEGEMAFVTGIGGRAADQAADEFWSLYVDGEPATVGAGSLVTEDGQEITWKLETFS